MSNIPIFSEDPKGFSEFLAYFEPIAKSYDLSTQHPNAYNIIEKHRFLIVTANTDDEKKDSLAFCKKQVIALKTSLINDFRNSSYRHFANGNPILLANYKMYLEYKSLSDGLILQDIEIENPLFESIKDHLDEDVFVKDGSYETICNSLSHYFNNGYFDNPKQINFVRASKMKIGWSLSSIYKEQKKEPLSYEYLKFAKEKMSLFLDVPFKEDNFRKTNLYKYFTQNPNKHKRP